MAPFLEFHGPLGKEAVIRVLSYGKRARNLGFGAMGQTYVMEAWHQKYPLDTVVSTFKVNFTHTVPKQDENGGAPASSNAE